MNYLKVLSVALLAMVATSCCSTCKTGKSMNFKPLTETHWQMIQIEGRAFSATEDSYTLLFGEEQKLTGRGDCNRIMGSYTRNDDGSLSMPAVAATRMMCPDQETENKFTATLSKVTSYSVDNGLLMLFVEGELKMILTPFEKK